MIPLNLHYIDDHTARLVIVGRTGLAAALTVWCRHLQPVRP